MTLKNYLIIIGVCTLLCLGAFLSVLFFINPFTYGVIGLLLFYLSLFFSLVGFLLLLGFALRFVFRRSELWQRQLRVSTRQAVLLSALFVAAMILQSGRFLVWWNFLSLLILFTLVEVFFMGWRRSN